MSDEQEIHHNLVFLGGSDQLQLEPGGKVYKPGDAVRLSQARRIALTAAGLRFGTDHPEDAPDAEPATKADVRADVKATQAAEDAGGDATAADSPAPDKAATASKKGA